MVQTSTLTFSFQSSKALVAPLLLLVVLFTLQTNLAEGQETAIQSISKEQAATESVKASFHELATVGIYSGIGETSMSRLGDRAAIILIRSYDLKQLEEGRNASAVAQILHMAFVDPNHIERVEDRVPKVSVLLTRYLLLTAKSTSERRILRNQADELASKRER